MSLPLPPSTQRLIRPWQGWCRRLTLILGLVGCLVMMPLPARAQNQHADCFDGDTVTALLNTRGYTFGCAPDNWSLYHVADETWYRGPQTLANIQLVQQEVFVSQFKSGQFDDYVRGDPPVWQNGTALQWQRDFAGVGYRRVAQDQDTIRTIPLFFIAMWAGGTLDVNSLAAALATRTDDYTTVELATLPLRYLDGQEKAPAQVAYVLEGAQMKELFNLDGGFLNTRYVIIQPTKASQALAGIPVFAFFSSSSIALADLESLLQSLFFRHRLPPTPPVPDQVAHLQTPLGLLELVPVLQSVAASLVAERRAEILDMALTFAQEVPYSNLLPFQLRTSNVNLYWAPAGLQTGRLILWHYIGGAHGNSVVTTWTFTAQGQPVALTDLLTVSEEEALALITEAAVQHLQFSVADMSATESRDWVTQGLTSLEDLSGWNPTIYLGQEGFWITLEPYVITPYHLGIQEFFVPMALQVPE